MLALVTRNDVLCEPIGDVEGGRAAFLVRGRSTSTAVEGVLDGHDVGLRFFGFEDGIALSFVR